MHRGRLWTMRQYAGFGTAEATNARSSCFRRANRVVVCVRPPTQMGYDSPSQGQRERWAGYGVAIDAHREIPLSRTSARQVTTAMTSNHARDLASPLRARRRGAGVLWPDNRCALSRKTSSDTSRGTYVYPPRHRCASPTSSVLPENPPLEPISISAITSAKRAHAVQEIALRSPTRSPMQAASTGLLDDSRPLVVLLERAQQLLRGDREIPRRPPDVVPHHDRALQREV